MSQVWQGEQVVPVTVLELEETSALSPLLKELKEGDMVRVSGISKGKGFQGVVKRHGFHGGPKSHGQKDRLRAPGSLGATAPQRVVKGKKMAGHTGTVRVTVRNLPIVRLIPEERVLMVRGAVPGMRGTRIEIKK